MTSPSLKALVRALPSLHEKGMTFDVWCWKVDEGLPLEKVDRLPRLFDWPVIGGLAFTCLARLRCWWRFGIRKQPRPDIIFTVACYVPSCDVCLVQFSPFDWAFRQKTLGINNLRDLLAWFQNQCDLAVAKHFYRHTRAQLVLCVSEAVREDLRKVNPQLNLQLLPNSYDPERFNPHVRRRFRDKARARLDFSEPQTVFAFASTGHYRRKGFHLAVDAISRLRKQHPMARLLVIGGHPGRLHALQQQLNHSHPDWRLFVTFTGMVSDMEFYLSAADALLFPSYSEAFALVEVESAALGLPLFLSRHHGAEMILRDGSNGRYVDFDAGSIAAVLAEFISGEWLPTDLTAQGALDSSAYAERLADAFVQARQQATSRKAMANAAA